MTSEDKDKDEIKNPDHVLDEYTDWFLEVVRRAFFPGDGAGAPLIKPAVFDVWIKDVQEYKIVSPEILNSILALNSELVKAAEQLMEETGKFMKGPSFDEYKKLTTYFEEFVNSLR